METIKRSALVPFSANQMYALVNDVERYPEFVPYCLSAAELSRDENKVRARLQVVKSGFAKSFTTENILSEPSRISMHLVDGPFKLLEGEWRFVALDEAACKIELDLRFEFSNRVASFAFARLFSQLVQSMVSAFTERAKQTYD